MLYAMPGIYLTVVDEIVRAALYCCVGLMVYCGGVLVVHGLVCTLLLEVIGACISLPEQD